MQFIFPVGRSLMEFSSPAQTFGNFHQKDTFDTTFCRKLLQVYLIESRAEQIRYAIYSLKYTLSSI